MRHSSPNFTSTDVRLDREIGSKALAYPALLLVYAKFFSDMVSDSQSKFKVFGDSYSDNCYKVQLLMNHLDLEYKWVEMDILAGETQSETFLAKNPNGKILLLELPSGEYLPESNATLKYLADGTKFLPHTPWKRAQVLSWQFFEQ